MSEQIGVSSAHTYLYIAETNDDYISLHPDDLAAIARTVIAQAEQIGKVRSAREKVRTLWREAEENDSLPHHYREGYVDALDIAEGLLDQVLGDTDD